MKYSNRTKKKLELDLKMYGQSYSILTRPSRIKRFFYCLVGMKAPNEVRRIDPRNVRHESNE